ncbi:MAG: LPS export ABC transporter periplasmic protein LptC [Candidatus Methylomirabilales bacterium]
MMGSEFRGMAVTVALAWMSLFVPSDLMAAEPAIPTPASPAQGPDAAIRGVRMIETRQGERLWEVEADKGEVFEDRGVAILMRGARPVRIVIYNGDEALTSFAEKAIVNLRTKDIQLTGQVQSESSKGTKIFTEVLNWSAGKRQLSTDAPVVVEKEGFQVQGKGMVADTILERMTIRERIASQINLSGKKGRRR